MSKRNSLEGKKQGRLKKVRKRELRLLKEAEEEWRRQVHQAPGNTARLMRAVGIPFHLIVNEGARCLGCDWRWWTHRPHEAPIDSPQGLSLGDLIKTALKETP